MTQSVYSAGDPGATRCSEVTTGSKHAARVGSAVSLAPNIRATLAPYPLLGGVCLSIFGGDVGSLVLHLTLDASKARELAASLLLVAEQTGGAA